jgi:TPR repeat protein
MSDPATSNGFLSGGRPSFFRYVVRLYATDPVFRGVIDFAVIGALVLLFMHPPSMEWFRGWMKPQVATTPGPVEPGRPQVSAPAQSTATNTGLASGPSTPPASTGAPPTSSAPSASGAPGTGGSAPVSASVPMPVLDEVGRPGLLSRFLIDIDENAFRSSEPEDRQRLVKAAQAHRAQRYAEMLDHLAGAIPNDPNVAFMRGVAAVYQRFDRARYSRAVAQFRVALAGGHLQSSTMLGVLLASGPTDVSKDVETGKRLIETAAAKGDRMAQRAAGIGYLGGEFGVLDPFRAAGFFKSAAAAGDLPAMVQYAYLLFTGTGIEKDEAAAEELVERAARGGLTIAQATLGSWIIDRYKAGVISDPSEGVRWLERAFGQGFSTTALIRLALFHGDIGRGPPWKDRGKAFELLSLGAPFADSRIHYAYATAFQFG